MLERAKACLTSGARDSLRCTPSAPRSKRMLHSAFWSHGAGHLDLPAYAISHLQTTPEPPLSCGSKRGSRVGARERGGKSLTAPPDGLFLDFLYPPQALAWLHGAGTGGKQREWWEKRNSKRLPEGYVQVTRRYASTSHPPTVATHAPNEQELALLERGEQVANDLDNIVLNHGDEKDDASPSGFEDFMADVVSDKMDEGRLAVETSGLDPRLGEFGKFIQNALSSIKPHAPSLSRFALDRTLNKALSLYESLPEVQKTDPKTKTELITLLCRIPRKTAESHCMSLYNSISPKERRLGAYAAALEIVIRPSKDTSQTNRYTRALDLNLEAWNNLGAEKANEREKLVRTLVKIVAKNAQWPLLVLIEEQLAEQSLSSSAAIPEHLRSNDTRHQSVSLCAIIEGDQNLLPTAHALLRYLGSKEGHNNFGPEMRRLASHFAAVASQQEFKKPKIIDRYIPGQILLSDNVRHLLDQCSVLGKSAIPVIEANLSELLRSDSSHDDEYSRSAVSYLYGKLLGFHAKFKYCVPESVFVALIERLCRYKTLPSNRGPINDQRIHVVLSQWKSQHGLINRQSFHKVLLYYAQNGAAQSFERTMVYFKSSYPDFADIKDVLWMGVYVHARNTDLSKAKAAFAAVQKLFAEHDEVPDLRCWNVLLYAQSRASDLEGALRNLQALVDHDLKPDKYTYHPILEMLGRRGDVASVTELIEDFDRLSGGKPQSTAFIGSLMNAHIKFGDMSQAYRVLREAIAARETKNGNNMGGKFTGCFNNLLTGYAMRRDIDNTMATYRWMKKEHVKADGNTYAALIHVLCNFRVPDQARTILNRVMKEEKIRPTAFHYALLMNGYSSQGMQKQALEVHKEMQAARVLPSVNSKVALLQTKVVKENLDLYYSENGGQGLSNLEGTIAALEESLLTRSTSDIAAKEPLIGATGFEVDSDPYALYFDRLIQVHANRRCFEAVSELYQRYQRDAEKRGRVYGGTAPFVLIGSLMSAVYRAGKFDELEQYWHLAKTKADEITRRKTFLSIARGEDQPVGDQPDLMVEPFDSVVDLGLGDILKDKEPNEPIEGMSTPDVQPAGIAPTAGHPFLLSRPFRQYMYGLVKQRRHLEIVSISSQLLKQGYKLDTNTWNDMIRHLCEASPPLTLLAFTLTERFLIPNFPGWASVRENYLPNPAAVAQRLQYIRARYLAPDTLIVQYPTLVHLGAALLKLRRLQAANKTSIPPDMLQYMGTLRQVQRDAPKTLFAVQSMPRREDPLQLKILRSGE